MAPQRDEIFKQKVNDCVQHIIGLLAIAEVHQFPCNSVMEFSEYLQWDRMAGAPVFCATLFVFRVSGMPWPCNWYCCRLGRVDRVWWLEPFVPYRARSTIVLPSTNLGSKPLVYNMDWRFTLNRWSSHARPSLLSVVNVRLGFCFAFRQALYESVCTGPTFSCHDNDAPRPSQLKSPITILSPYGIAISTQRDCTD